METVRVVWCRRTRLFRALIGLALLLAAADSAADYLLEGHPSWPLFLMFSVVGLILSTLFAVTCHRIVLLGEQDTPRYGIHSWSRREMRFLGWTVVGFFFFSVISMSLGIFAGIASASHAKRDDLSLLMWFVFLPGWYVMARLAVLLPATAIDERHDMKWAWGITSKNGWRLVVILVLLPWLLNSVVDFFELKRYLIMGFIVHLLTYAMVAAEIAALSITFRFLTCATTDEAEANIAPSVPLNSEA